MSEPTAAEVFAWLSDHGWTDDRPEWLVVIQDVLDARNALLCGVPGGGEPQPGTDDSGPERARQMIDEVTAEHARTWPKPPAWAVRPIDAPVRPVAVGDQPDTPCPHCGGSGRVPTWFADTGATEPCPACPEDGTNG